MRLVHRVCNVFLVNISLVLHPFLSDILVVAQTIFFNGQLKLIRIWKVGMYICYVDTGKGVLELLIRSNILKRIAGHTAYNSTS